MDVAQLNNPARIFRHLEFSMAEKDRLGASYSLCHKGRTIILLRGGRTVLGLNYPKTFLHTQQKPLKRNRTKGAIEKKIRASAFCYPGI